MKATFSAPKRGWLVAALTFGSLVVGSCSDNNLEPTQVERVRASAANADAGVGNAQTLTYTLTPDPVYGSANFVVPDSIQFRHHTWVQAVATGSVRRIATYPWTEVPNDTTFDASQGYSYVSRGYNFGNTYIGTSPVDIEFYRPAGEQTPGAVGFLGHGAGTIDPDNYAPPGYPHVDCGPTKPIHCESYSGSITITITPYQSTLFLTADSSSYHPGSTASFNLFFSPTSLNGHGTPYDADSSWWVPDSVAAGGDPSEQAVSGPGLSAMNNPSIGHRILVGSGTMSVSGWVNGVWQKKSVHLNVTSLKLTGVPGRVHPGDSVTFTPSWTDGATVTSVSGWSWTANSPPGATSTTGCAGLVVCKTKVQESGTMKVSVTRNGVTRTATAQIGVYSNFQLTEDKATANYGDTVTFTPKYDGIPGPAGRWRWVPADTSTHDTLACDSGVTNCKKQIVGSGIMWAYVSSTAGGGGDSDSKAVTMTNHLELRAAPSLVDTGGVVTFRPYLNGHPTQATAWKWTPDPSAPRDSTAGCPAPALECHRATFESGTMWAYDSLSDAASVNVTVSAACAGGLMSAAKRRALGLGPARSRVVVAPTAPGRQLAPVGQSARTGLRIPAGRPLLTVDCRDSLATRGDSGTDTLPPAVLHMIVESNGLNAQPPAGDWSFPVGTVLPYSVSPQAGYGTPVAFLDDTLMSAASGQLTMTSDHRINTAVDTLFSLRPGIADLRTRLRALVTATDKPLAWARYMLWSLDSSSVLYASDDALDDNVALAQYLEFDPVADGNALAAWDDGLGDYTFEVHGTAGNHFITIVPPNDTALRFVMSSPDTVIADRVRAQRRQAGRRPTFDQLPTPDTVAFVFVNGIRTLEPSAFRTGKRLHQIVSNAALFPHAFGASFWNPQLRGVILKAWGADDCTEHAKQDASFLTRLTAYVRYKACSDLQDATIALGVEDMGKAILAFANTEFNAPDPNFPSADSLAHRLSYYHKAGYHTVAVTHSYGNMLFAQAATRIPTLDGSPLQSTACTAAMSLAAPINKENFNIDQAYLRGMTIKNDILLQVPPVGLPNNFDPLPDHWTNETSDSADVAIAAAFPGTTKFVQAKWGVKIHDVDHNYMASRLKSVLIGYLGELYNQCKSPGSQ